MLKRHSELTTAIGTIGIRIPYNPARRPSAEHSFLLTFVRRDRLIDGAPAGTQTAVHPQVAAGGACHGTGWVQTGARVCDMVVMVVVGLWYDR